MKENSFGIFLSRTREDRGVSMKGLGAGICSESLVSKIESGERFPDKLMRDRLLARLGERGYEYENFLQQVEYEDWREREDILEALETGKAAQAENKLEEYYHKKKADKVERQFYLAMKLQLLEQGRGEQEKKVEYLTEAVQLTIPWKDKKKLREWVLSIEELNLILEYVAYVKPVNEEERYREILSYLKAEHFDEECRAMLTSKVAFYYCCYLWDRLKLCVDAPERQSLAEQAIKVSEEGIESLRDNERLYFAWELFQKEAEVLQVLLTEGKSEKTERTRLIKRQKWNREFFEVLDGLYEQFHVPKMTCAYTYFYREYEIYCLNDVLRARRKMLGYGKDSFEADGECTYRSVCRIESGEGKVHRTLVKHMLRKLNLSAELQRAQIITDSQQALRLEKEYRNTMNQREFIKAEQQLQQLKEMIPMDLLINRQYIEQSECDLEFYLNRISKEEYIERLKQVLELTVPWEAAMESIADKRLRNGCIQRGEKYLTNREIDLLKTLSSLHGNGEDNPYPALLLEYYRQCDKMGNISTTITMREYVMAYLEKYFRGIGNYDFSDQIGMQMLIDGLRFRRVGQVDYFLYSLMYNNEKRKRNNLPVQVEPDRQACLEKCIILTDFCKDKFRNQWTKRKLKEYLESN